MNALRQQKKFISDLRKLQTAQQNELEQNAGRTDAEVAGIEGILGKLNEQLETFGLDAGQKAVRELEKLNASESELATARQKMAELTAKQADAEAKKAEEQELQAAEDKANQAAESINQMLQTLADEVSDLRLDPEDRGKAKATRELAKLGATPEQSAQARSLMETTAGLADAGAAPAERSFSAQGGTFSSLAASMFGSGSGDPLKDISESSAETAKNTKAIAKNGNPITFGV